MIKDFLFVLFKLSHMALQHSLSSLVWTGCALPRTAITSNHSKKSMWIFWRTYAKARITVTPGREAAWCFGSLNATPLSFNSKCLAGGGHALLLGCWFGGIFFFSFSKVKHQSRVQAKAKVQGDVADNLRKKCWQSKTFLRQLLILINTGEDLKQYNGPLSPARVSYRLQTSSDMANNFH